MTKKENLFLLIKSLTKPEKRYFKIFAGINSKNKNYIKLFYEIDKQTAYDESLVKEKFKKENFTNQLHVTKIYLNKLILKSLRNYNSKISVEAELKDALRNIEILFNKELLSQCRYEIERAESLAEKYEKLPTLLNVLEWRRKLHLTKRTIFSDRTNVNEVLESKQIAIDKLLVENKYWDLTINYFNQQENESFIQKKNMLLDDVQNAKTIQAKILFYHLKYVGSVVQNNPEEGLNYISELISLLEKYPERIKDDSSSYITALNNKMGLLLSEKRLRDIPALIKKVRGVPDKYKLKDRKIRVRLLMRTYNVELEMYRDAEQFDLGSDLISEIDDFLRENADSVPEDYFVLFYYQFAYIFFMKQSYSESLCWINNLLNLKEKGMREDLQSFARFLNLIIHFELNNIFVLKYSVDACRRFLKKKRELKGFEKVLLKFFSKLSTVHKEKYPGLFYKLKNELFINTSVKDRLNILDYLNFERWIERRLTAYSKAKIKLPK